MAQRLTDTKFQVPHYYATVAVDMDALFDLRAQINTEFLDEADTKVSVNDLLIKAAALASKSVP